MKRLINAMAATIAIVSLSSCGGGGGSDVAVTPTGGSDVAVTPTFPPTGSATTATSVSVVGRFAGTRSGTVSVNGIPATVTGSTWRTDNVPLEPGRNTLTVRTGTQSSAAEIEITQVGVSLRQPEDLALSADGTTAFIVDPLLGALVALDLDTGQNRIVSNAAVGAGPSLTSPSSVVVNTAGEEALVIDSFSFVTRVDLGSGNRTQPASSGPGQSLVHLAFDESSNTGYLTDAVTQSVISFDPDTGNRNFFSVAPGGFGAPPGGVGGGPGFENPGDILIDRTLGRALVTNRSFSGLGWSLFAVDLASGDRTILFADNERHNVPTIAFNPDGDVFIGDNDRAALRLVDVSTGQSSIIADDSRGQGPAFENISSVAYRSTTGDILVADKDAASVLSVDARTGNRTVLTSSVNGSGPGLRLPSAMVHDILNGRAFILDLTRRVMAVDLDSGDRTIVSSNTRNSGPGFGALSGIAYDASRNRVLVSDEFNVVIFAVDADSGVRSVLSSSPPFPGPLFPPARGSGPPLTGLEMVVDPVADRVLVAGTSGLMAVDLESGDRAIIGDPVANVQALTLDADGRRAWAISYDAGQALTQLVELDLNSGARENFVVDVPTMCTDCHPVEFGITYDPLANRLIVTGTPITRIVTIDLDDKSQSTIVPEPDVAAELEWQLPAAIVADAGRDTAWVLDRGPGSIHLPGGGGLLMVELDGGERVIVSK